MIVPHYDISGLLTRYDVTDDSITSHPRKQLLSMTRSMSPEDRGIIRQYVDDSFNRFKEIVKSGRPKLREANTDDALLDPDSKRDLATGEIFPARRALQFGLVDEIGFVEDAIARAIELAGLEEDGVRVVEYERPPSLLNLAGMAQAADQQSEFRTLPGVQHTSSLLSDNDPAATARHGKQEFDQVIAGGHMGIPVVPYAPSDEPTLAEPVPPKPNTRL